MAKVCNKCGMEKPETEFYTRTNGKLNNRCKKCHNLHNRCKNRKPYNSEYTKYGLTVEQHAELLARGCEVCGTLEDLVVDHCQSQGMSM